MVFFISSKRGVYIKYKINNNTLLMKSAPSIDQPSGKSFDFIYTYFASI